MDDNDFNKPQSFLQVYKFLTEVDMQIAACLSITTETDITLSLSVAINPIILIEDMVYSDELTKF